MALLFRSVLILSIMLQGNSGDRPVITGKKDVQELPIFTVGIFADVQYADEEPSINRYYRMSVERLREAYATFLGENADFAINLGDLIDKNYESYAPVLEVIRSSGIPTFHVPGNHDFSVADSLKRKLPVLKSWLGYYSEAKEGFRFIFLNGNEVSTYGATNEILKKGALSYLKILKEEKKINAMEWNGGLASNQVDFLKRELDSATRNHEKTLIFCHFPIYPENIHNLFNYEEVLQLLRKYNNVIAWLSGHNHAGNYDIYGTTHFITLRGMVDSHDSNSFAIMRIYNNKVVLKGYGREQDREIRF